MGIHGKAADSEVELKDGNDLPLLACSTQLQELLLVCKEMRDRMSAVLPDSRDQTYMAIHQTQQPQGCFSSNAPSPQLCSSRLPEVFVPVKRGRSPRGIGNACSSV